MPSSITNYTEVNSTLQFHLTPDLVSISFLFISQFASHANSHGAQAHGCPWGWFLSCSRIMRSGITTHQRLQANTRMAFLIFR